MMNNYLIYPTCIIFIALIASFGILLITKLGIRGIIAERSKIKLISQLFECDFCLSFWTNFALSLLLALILHDCVMIVLPVLAAPITRKLIL